MGGRELRRALGFSLALGSILLLAGCDHPADVDNGNEAVETCFSSARSGPASPDGAPRQLASTSTILAPVDTGDRAIFWLRVQTAAKSGGAGA